MTLSPEPKGKGLGTKENYSSVRDQSGGGGQGNVTVTPRFGKNMKHTIEVREPDNGSENVSALGMLLRHVL